MKLGEGHGQKRKIEWRPRVERKWVERRKKRWQKKSA
jgi:hypothetical protein